MENNKYYTPKIEEFHVGFEFEVNYTDEGWVKETFYGGEGRDIRSVDKLNKMLGRSKWENAYRVKYLDKEDIESLGFHTEDNGECYNKSIGWLIIGIYPWYDLGGDINEYKITVDSNTNFHGIIKNKSELRRILKQLNINDKENNY